MMGRQGAVLLCLLWTPSLRPAEPVRAELAAVKAQKLERSITLPGELVPYESVTLFARIPGFVEKVLVDKGSQVRLGQTLVTLSAPEIALQTAAAESKFRTAKSERAEAEARRQGAQLTYEQLKEASKTEGAISEAEVLQALSALEAAKAAVDAAAGSVDAAESALRVTRQMEEYLIVTAPFEGVVTARHVHPGALVGPAPNAAILRLEHISRLRLDVGVPEADSAGIVQGAVVTFTVPAYRTRRFAARVARVSRSVDLKSRTMSVELDFDNSSGLLAPGMYAEVLWPVRTSGEVLAVPSTAVVRTTDRTFVVRVKQGEAEWVDVRRGASLGDMVEVTGDLTPGDLVLRRGTDEVRPGRPVQGLGKK
ncbi:MAG: efflux RND transporter periplasmic adaptor subunit [Bryobacterales bacterium]|nr:efflux RND transporter periplasmic adaptor subunit [Bryobacterales bacterium]